MKLGVKQYIKKFIQAIQEVQEYWTINLVGSDEEDGVELEELKDSEPISIIKYVDSKNRKEFYSFEEMVAYVEKRVKLETLNEEIEHV